jgi:DNA-binding PadR family transcriptional regulator
MLAIDIRDCDILVTAPHPHGGIAPMLVALEDAGLGVSRIEPRGDEAGMYRLRAKGSSETVVRVLEGIGCRVTPQLRSESPWRPS